MLRKQSYMVDRFLMVVIVSFMLTGDQLNAQTVVAQQDFVSVSARDFPIRIKIKTTPLRIFKNSLTFQG